MKTVAVRVRERTQHVLKAMAARSGESMPDLLEKAVEDYRRRQFFADLTEDYTRLKRDPKAWEDELQERRLWDATLADGLEEQDGG